MQRHAGNVIDTSAIIDSAYWSKSLLIPLMIADPRPVQEKKSGSAGVVLSLNQKTGCCLELVVAPVCLSSFKMDEMREYLYCICFLSF